MKNHESTMFHIHLSPRQGAGYAILPGDPGRVEKIAVCLENPTPVAVNREFTTWSGTLEGKRVLVTSTGIGGPSASIAMEELIQCGVHTFLRVGTCGGMQPEILSGDVIIPTGAIRMEGTSKEYLPLEFPAVAHYDIVSSLVQAASSLQAGFHTGVIHSKDSFYGQHNPRSMPVGQELLEKWEAFRKGGALASEMECAALFSVAAARKVRAGAVLACIWNQEREKLGLENPEVLDTSSAIRIAVEALRLLIRQDK